MTVTAMQTLVAQILGDPSNQKYTNANQILPSLNTAQMEFVHKALAYGAGGENIFDQLTELQASTEQSVDTTGYDLDGLASSPGPFIPGGYIASRGTIDSVTRWIARVPMRSLAQRNNTYLKGNDENPLCYIFTNNYYLLVTTGTYPVTTTIYYIREPKELVASGASGYQVTTCELNTMHHRLICKMAAADCFLLSKELERYMALSKEIEDEIKMIATGNKVEPSAETMEAWRKK